MGDARAYEILTNRRTNLYVLTNRRNQACYCKNCASQKHWTIFEICIILVFTDALSEFAEIFSK